ncbi:fibronectin type III [Algibacter mikhailovii]|uniref:fibronectin type III n=1 Tax=Algibacter mikhailovii TaxID=425498 RepID=UPI0024952039|nr:fibronectin type III [Algibacter mikhailovii]
MKYLYAVIILFLTLEINGQVRLDADGPGDTYELITSVLAPGYNPIEVPDCGHVDFGDHIDELFDSELNTNVFRFYMHVTPDNDRCRNFDRQRNEIKSYSQSPDNLLGVVGEQVIYKWKFKLADGFQSSPNFTHLHQLKSVGGPFDGMPMYTITTRKGSPDRLELRYAEINSQITLKRTDLEPFIGTWLEVSEVIEYGTSGAYAIEIKRISDGAVLFEYSNDDLVHWRQDAEFVRPKWGIYRSLNNPQDLRDEQVLFANFSVEEVETLSAERVSAKGN